MKRKSQITSWGSRSAAALFVFVVSAAPALAEVCDKEVGEYWMPGDGPWWPLLTGGLPWFAVVALATGWLCDGLKLWRSCALVAFFYLLVSLLFWLVNLGPGGPFDYTIRENAYLEGCMSLASDIVSAGVKVALSLLLFWTAWRVRNRVRQ